MDKKPVTTIEYIQSLQEQITDLSDKLENLSKVVNHQTVKLDESTLQPKPVPPTKPLKRFG